jgi:hypothetical protein
MGLGRGQAQFTLNHSSENRFEECDPHALISTTLNMDLSGFRVQPHALLDVTFASYRYVIFCCHLLQKNASGATMVHMWIFASSRLFGELCTCFPDDNRGSLLEVWTMLFITT